MAWAGRAEQMRAMTGAPIYSTTYSCPHNSALDVRLIYNHASTSASALNGVFFPMNVIFIHNVYICGHAENVGACVCIMFVTICRCFRCFILAFSDTRSVQ